LLIIAEPGSGRSTTIALALKEAKRLPVTGQEESEMQLLIFDGIVAGAAFLRFVGCSSCASDGQSLLRSLVVEMRSILEPDSCTQRTIPSAVHELEEELLSCLRLASVECPIILVVDGIERLPEGDPIKRLHWLPQQLPQHSRVLICASPDFCSSEILSQFLPINILHQDSLSQHEVSLFVNSWRLNEQVQ
jgi:hypothetical protein